MKLQLFVNALLASTTVDLPADDDLARKLILAEHTASRHANGCSASPYIALPGRRDT